MADSLVCVSVPAESRTSATELVSDFDAVVRENQRRIYRILLALVRDSDVADNLTQECFVRAYQKRRSFRGDASVSTWLTRMAVNLARDHGRNKKSGFWRSLFERSVEPGDATCVADRRSSPEQALLAREATGIVLEELSAMPPQQREVFALRFFEELSLEEIASVVECEVGTVKSHLFRAVKRVRARLSR
jgi:RNA polymerase sigma-70 factor, ECF subfamily